MFHTFKIVLYVIMLVYCLATIKGSVIRYKDIKNLENTMELVARCLIIPGLIFLLITEML